MVVISLAMAALGVIGSVFLIMSSNRNLAEAKQKATELEPQAAAALAVAQQADTLMSDERVLMLTRNIELYKAVQTHIPKHPNFYRQVMPYIPGFYRVYSMSVTPAGDNAVQLNLTGTIQSFQQYADLMLALLRIPGARSVSRSGYVLDNKMVPGLNEFDQRAEPRRVGDPQLSEYAAERVNELIARAGTEATGFQNVAGYGQPNIVKTAMPRWSDVQVSVLLESVAPGAGTAGVSYDLRTPNPRATLTTAPQAGAVSNGAPAPGGGAPGAPGPSGPGGPPPGSVPGPPRGGRGEDI